MRLWLLSPREIAEKADDPWEPWFDKNFGMVVRAPDEATARTLARKAAWGEGADAWSDPALSSCVELTANGEAGVIMTDVWRA
jgi:hypothetical protein